MCTCEYTRFACGHEHKRRYINCATGQEMADSSGSACGSVDFTVSSYARAACGAPGCDYVECMVKGWACCRCGRGPNEGHVCRQDTTPWRWDYAECGHRFCDGCRSWGKRRRRRSESRGREDTRRGLFGGLGKGGGGSARYW